MFRNLKRFRSDENGAITADWVLLTAATVTFGVAAILTIQDGSQSVTTQSSGYMNDQDLSGMTDLQQVYSGGDTTPSE